MADIGVYDERYCKTLFAATLLDRGGMDWGAWDALAAAGEQAVPTLVKGLDPKKFYGEDAENFDVLLCLGKMGPSAKGAIPALKKLLEDPKIKDETKMSIRVVLANAGSETTETAKFILKKMGDEGSWEEEAGAIRTIARIHPGDWIAEDIAQALNKLHQRLEGTGNEVALWTAIALGVAGERSKVAIKPLTEKVNKLPEDSILRSVYWAVLARIHPEGAERTAAVRMMLKTTGRMERDDLPTIFNTALYLIDKPMLKQIATLIDDKDMGVVNGAITYLMVIGKQNPDAKTRLVAVMQKSKDEELRSSIAYALLMVASYKDIPELEKLQAAERDQKVQKILAMSCACLKLDWAKVEDIGKSLD